MFWNSILFKCSTCFLTCSIIHKCLLSVITSVVLQLNPQLHEAEQTFPMPRALSQSDTNPVISCDPMGYM